MTDDGYYVEEESWTIEGLQQTKKVLEKVPPEIIRNAKGLAIFATLRAGLWIGAGAGGSGVLLSRLDNGTWSPPSAIRLHADGDALPPGMDIYDCLLVVNTDDSMKALRENEMIIGSGTGIAPGPLGCDAKRETPPDEGQVPMYSYVKGHRFSVDFCPVGTTLFEQADENEKFYGQQISAKEILDGNVLAPHAARRLLETLRVAQGDTSVEQSMLPTESPPGDYELSDDERVFGIPDVEDPDPFGVRALEKEGFSVKEAGTKKRASWEAFQFKPSPTSPVHHLSNRNNTDRPWSLPPRMSWRAFGLGTEANPLNRLRESLDLGRVTKMTNEGTQTDDRPSAPQDLDHRRTATFPDFVRPHNSKPLYMREVPEHQELDLQPEPAINALEITPSKNGYTTPPDTPPSREKRSSISEPADEEEDACVTATPVFESAQSASAQAVIKARVVHVPKRIAPNLPPRNPSRKQHPADEQPPTSPLGATESLARDNGATNGDSTPIPPLVEGSAPTWPNGHHGLPEYVPQGVQTASKTMAMPGGFA